MSIRRLIILICFFIASFSLTARCSIVTYSDKYLSFEYDTDDYISIYTSETDNEMFVPLSYSMSADMIVDNETCYCSISLLELDDGWRNDIAIEHDASIISNDPFEIEYITEEGSHVNCKAIGEHGNQMLLMSFSFSGVGDEGYLALKRIYDSATCSDAFKNSGYSFSSDKSEYIYRNVLLSDEAIAYAQQALNICDAYLTFQIDASTADKKMDSIITAVDGLEDKTFRKCDQYVYSAIFTSGTYFFLENDAKIVEIKTELEKLLSK